MELDLDIHKVHLHSTPSFNLTFCLHVIICKPIWDDTDHIQISIGKMITPKTTPSSGNWRCYQNAWLMISQWHHHYFIICPNSHNIQGSPHIVKTGRLDFSLNWLKGEVRENLGDFRKSIPILTFLSPLPHVPLPFTKRMCAAQRS